MAQSELMSTKYFEQAEEDRRTAAAQEAEAMTEPPSRRPASAIASWERYSSWISGVAAVAVIACIGVVAVPYFSATGSGKRSSPIDWFLRLGGAKQGQTFEKFMKDTLTTNQRTFEESFSKSPAFKFDAQTIKLDPKSLGWQIDTKPRRRK